MTNTTLTKIVHRQRRGFLRDLMWAAGFTVSYVATVVQFPL